MRILVFEFLTSGGVADLHPLSESDLTFLHQGHMMHHAVCQDLLELGHEIVTPVDQSVELPIPSRVTQIAIQNKSEVDQALLAAADNADRVLIIAPESDGTLEHYVSLLQSHSSKFISPQLDFVQLTSDKWKCHQWLTDHGVPCPQTELLSNEHQVATLPDSFFPCVAKPVSGAGSEHVRLVKTRNGFGPIESPVLLQEFCEGIAASVSVVSSLKGEPIILEPGRQIFDTEPFGRHLKTEFPLDRTLRKRAIDLAKKTADALPRTSGYFGIDIVLAEVSSDDVVIEVNPRLTTSYSFLRDWSGENVAGHFVD